MINFLFIKNQDYTLIADMMFPNIVYLWQQLIINICIYRAIVRKL
jgi:hypothetical protein